MQFAEGIDGNGFQCFHKIRLLMFKCLGQSQIKILGTGARVKSLPLDTFFLDSGLKIYARPDVQVKYESCQTSDTNEFAQCTSVPHV